MIFIYSGLFLINLILAVINQSFEKFHEDINSNSQNEILPKITDYSLSNIPGNISADLEKLKNNSYVYKKSKKKTESKLPTIRQKLNKIFQSQIYLAFVTVVILLNTIFLSLDHYPMTKEFGDMLNSANFFFTVFFFFEMIIKIFAFGPLIYIKDKMNLFDLFIVWSSILDLILQFTLSNNGISQISSLAALRAFRLFRMFKILRAWSDLKILIQALIESLISLKYFSILLLNFMVIATFLGNELFAYRVRFISETDFAPDL